MIKNSTQQWEIGETVKVGFMKLVVLEKEPTPGDYAPDAYILRGICGNADRRYRFVPHKGLERIK